MPTSSSLDEIVKNSSEQNRNFFIAYLALLLYVLAVVFSTTDLQLLVSSEGLKLPIVDLTVPLTGFYFVIPIFVIALHFNFLQNLESHHYKLMYWKKEHPIISSPISTTYEVPREKLYPFIFDYATLEKEGQFYWWVKLANSIFCYNLAPTTLGLLLVRYTDCQDFLMTLWHYVAFIFDVFLVWKFDLGLKNNEQKVSGNSIINISNWLFFRDAVKEFNDHGFFGFVLLVETLLTGAIGWTNDNNFVFYIQPSIQAVSNLDENNFFSRPIELLLPRIAIDSNETVWNPDSKKLELAAKLAGDDKGDIIKYLQKDGKGGFVPDTKNLRLSRLSEQNLAFAQLSEVKLEGADLRNSQLQGANLSNAQLQGANLSNVDMNGANIKGMQIRGAKLDGMKHEDIQKLKAQT